jgi:hypothetical protein
MDESAKSLELEQVWESRFQELSAFKTATGHLNLAEEAPVPVSATLLGWVKTQRSLQREGRLAPKRKEKLDVLGFDWNPHDTVWTKWFTAYKEFVAKHGRSDVAFIKQFDKDLSIWVNHQKCALGQGRVPGPRARELRAAGMTPAARAERKKHSEADQARKQTVQELASYVAENGHAQLPPSKDPASLFMRVRKMRHIRDKRKNNWFVSELQRLGAFEQFPTFAWETAFSAWKAYVAASGDFACAQTPPRNVIAWVKEVRAELHALEVDTLQVPLTQRPKRQAQTEARISVMQARGRLLTAGFVVEPRALGERDMVRRKVALACGFARTADLPLRALLRVATDRAQAGLLEESATQALQALGFERDAKSGAWRLMPGENRVQGPEMLPRQQTQMAPAPRTHAGATRRARARFRKEQPEKEQVVRETTRVPAFVDDIPAWEEPPRLLIEIRRQLEFTDRPTTAEALLRRPSVQRVLSSDDEAQNLEEVEGVLEELVKYGWLEFVPAARAELSMRKVQRVAYAE